jgi:hypothetical protein
MRCRPHEQFQNANSCNMSCASVPWNVCGQGSAARLGAFGWCKIERLSGINGDSVSGFETDTMRKGPDLPLG